jgi:pyrroloquinoline quinone biosynthesis protein B
LVVLGTAQDGGLPHAGCLCRNCSTARNDPTFERLPASIGLVAADESLMVDATSAFERQVHRLWRAATSADATGERFGPPRTIVLTHAHTGHYAGLWQLDRSVMAARGVEVVGSASMIAFLAAQEPWAAMQREGFIRLLAVPLGQAFEPLDGVRVTLLPVPHRSELGVDTVALFIDGPLKKALYLPDIDAWDDWDVDLREIVGGVDLALLDGCFWEPFHIPGVPHPPIRDSMQRLASLMENGATRVTFTHLNHSNPACDPASPEAAEIAARGFAVAREGEQFGL